MFLPWSKAHQRRELLARPLPDAWRGWLSAHVPYYRALPAGGRQKLEGVARVLAAEKNWEGAGGLAVTEEMTVAVAGRAAVPILGFDDEYYPNVETVIVYPQPFLVPVRRPGPGGLVVETTVPYAGEAALQGPVVLSWADVLGSGPGRDVVTHEFAHKLDMRDGAADGAPYLRDAAQVETWARTMSAEYQDLVARTQAGEPALLDPYGATDAAEFFAVATEGFFGLPRRMQAERPELYEVLRDFYRQDPAALTPARDEEGMG